MPVEIAFRSVVDDPIWAEAMARVGDGGVKDEVYSAGDGHMRRVVPRNDELGGSCIFSAWKQIWFGITYCMILNIDISQKNLKRN